MKSFVIILTLILSQNNCLAQSTESLIRQYEELKKCDADALMTVDKKVCSSDACEYERANLLSKLACSIMLKETAAHQMFFNKEKLKTSKSSQKYKELEMQMGKIGEEDIQRLLNTYQRLGAELYNLDKSERAGAEVRRLEREEIRQGSFQNGVRELTNGLNMLQRPGPQNHTYQINGKLITCTTLNNFTSCN
jgi:hypothetical protein